MNVHRPERVNELTPHLKTITPTSDTLTSFLPLPPFPLITPGANSPDLPQIKGKTRRENKWVSESGVR